MISPSALRCWAAPQQCCSRLLPSRTPLLSLSSTDRRGLARAVRRSSRSSPLICQAASRGDDDQRKGTREEKLQRGETTESAPAEERQNPFRHAADVVEDALVRLHTECNAHLLMRISQPCLTAGVP